MLWSLLFLFLVVLVAGAVVLYVAYPHRGEDLPYAAGLGDKMRQAVEALPVLSEEEGRLLRR